MKKLLLFILFPIISYGQIQIGNDIDGETSGDQSGFSVSLSSDGTIIAIGAPSNNGNGTSSGHVRVYENQSGVWTQIGDDIDGEGSNDGSGIVSLSSDGSIVAIGSSNGSNFSGHVRVFENINGTWTQIGENIDGEASNDQSGRSVGLSSDGTVVAIGANLNNGNGTFSGHVRVYENQSDVWTQIGDDIDGEGSNDFSGRSISLSSDGTIVAIGAEGNDDNGNDSGHVRIYENQSGSWTQIGDDIDGEGSNDFSGIVSLSSDGTIVAIGAEGNDDNGNDSGHVRVYENQSGVWIQIGDDIDGETSNDGSGRSISLSSDGSIVAIGADFNDDNGNDAGHVRIYRNQSGVWTQIGDDIDGEGSNDFSGISVSLSSDGSIVAIGALNNDGNGNDSGHVRVFDLSSVLSIEEVSQSQFSIYPNPASTSVTIGLKQESSLQKITIYNSIGQAVKTSIQETIDVSDLSQGVYIMDVMTDKGRSSQKLIIE
ncbi:T9SS type A sorting domain-containing protein [uncultured Dokdonia sp.]|uniref:T9SS type A sorting domain-containing protein n=1 Tax=uncultured Dokdonia sp. TaxID=575653 RepID=UPI00260AC824|nr:T9SS type A sorting domain-containing protein [uncultured Dokdonia sp.]